MTAREASHAGSWYSASGSTLSAELDGWLQQVPGSVDGLGRLPVSGARVIIAPHAGYAYSGPAAAWAYKSLDLSQAKRIFLLGPSHHVHLSGLALSAHSTYTTPLGALALDTATISELRATGKFETMSPDTDADEHSLEMHLPYIYKMLSLHFGPPSAHPPLIPLLVGATRPDTERSYGQMLAPYLADPSSVFVISSDFCHWGSRFSYTYYLPSLDVKSPAVPPGGYTLSRNPPARPAIHESISVLDHRAMASIEAGSHADFLAELRMTANTVCGRHPIGVIMAAMETVRAEREGGPSAEEGKGGTGEDGEKKARHFHFIRYEQSSACATLRDSSVSYASAYAVI
ncbi:MAG: hypothetical protein M1838_003018 [Thelocarpon superellum]|nr:MAG: hypothetical protein M1838_003018 [Thelocarpon superellum]